MFLGERSVRWLTLLTGLSARQLSLIGLGMVAALAGYIYSSSNRLLAAEATQGAPTALFTVSDVHYRLDPAMPTRIDTVAFRVSAPWSGPPPRLSIQLTQGGPSYPCVTSPTGVICSPTEPSALVASVTSLIVTTNAPEH